jgi:phosphate transport system permease protein
VAPEPAASDQRFILRATGRVARRQALSRASFWVLLAATVVGLLVLAYLLYDILENGSTRLFTNWPDFITNYASSREHRAGIRAALLGTLWVIGLTILFTIPIGVGTSLWIEEFAPRNRFLTIVRLNVSNLAGVPSIIYGILGLAVFARLFDLGPSILTGALTLSLMVLPIVIISSAEAIRQVPSSLRDGSLALGATRWETVWYHVLPGSIPGIMTGMILSISRAIGETAALIMIGAFAFVAFDPTSWNDRFVVLPIQIYAWTIQPGDNFKVEASAAIIVLMVVVLSLNLVAVLIRNRFRRD